MNKLTKILTAIVILAAGVAAFFMLVHNSVTDRINPFIKAETSYAKVATGTQNYTNVTIYDERGQKENYQLASVGGYDPAKGYLTIKHKGQYVSYVEYISAAKYKQITGWK